MKSFALTIRTPASRQNVSGADKSSAGLSGPERFCSANKNLTNRINPSRVFNLQRVGLSNSLAARWLLHQPRLIALPRITNLLDKP